VTRSVEVIEGDPLTGFKDCFLTLHGYDDGTVSLVIESPYDDRAVIRLDPEGTQLLVNFVTRPQ